MFFRIVCEKKFHYWYLHIQCLYLDILVLTKSGIIYYIPSLCFGFLYTLLKMFEQIKMLQNSSERINIQEERIADEPISMTERMVQD